MPNKQEYIQKAEQEFYKTYNRYPVIFDHGDGVSLYDMEGEEYLDFGAGIAVMGLGYNDKQYNEAVKAQVISFCTPLIYFTMCLPSKREKSS